MKTGRRRQKDPAQIQAQEAAEAASEPKPQPSPVARQPAKSGRRPSIVEYVLIAVVVVIAIVVIVMITRSCSRPQASTYLPAEAEGTWVTTLQVLAPQIVEGEGWRSACETTGNCAVVADTCEMRERRDQFSEREVENYDDYAYSIYYEELTKDLYEASGSDFTVTQLNPDEDRWEGERHYVSEEWLDVDTCEYTDYTVWITDPDDTSQEVEVVLSECEVWDHVVVKERVYEEEEYCQTETVQGMAVVDTITDEGLGSSVNWPTALRPEGGEVQSSFEGEVVFRADGTTYAVTVTDPDAYVRYLTVPYYLGLNDEGRVVRVVDRVPED